MSRLIVSKCVGAGTPAPYEIFSCEAALAGSAA